jgi:hypothetical protein
MKAGLCGPSILAAIAAVALGGCAAKPAPPPPLPTGRTTTISLTGTPGAAFTGYLIRDGRKEDLSGVLPRTVEDFGITECEVRKARVEDHLVLEARDGSSFLRYECGPPLPGVRADLEGGWAVMGLGAGSSAWLAVLPLALATTLLVVVAAVAAALLRWRRPAAVRPPGPARP